MHRPRNDLFLVLGRAGMDLYADPPGTPIEDGARFFACLGGSAGNIAAGLARQGARVAMLSAVSDDAVGRHTINALKTFGVSIDHVSLVGGEHRTSLAIVDTRGDQTQAVLYRNEAADFQLTSADVAQARFDDLGALIVTGTALARSPSREATMVALAMARAAGATTVIDLDYRRYSWSSAAEAAMICAAAADASDVIVGNDEEFAMLAGGDIAEGLELARALGGVDGRIVVYKMGAAGSRTITADGEFESGVYQTNALKPTGAGDGFMAGFLAALTSGATLRGAVTRGAATAAIVVGRVGCSAAMPTSEEIDRLIAEQGEAI